MTGGQSISQLMKYSIGTTTWSSLGNLPFTPYYGTEMSYYNGKLYFWRAIISEICGNIR